MHLVGFLCILAIPNLINLLTMRNITKLLFLSLICVSTFTSCTKDSDFPVDSADLKTANLSDAVAYSQIELEILTAVNEYRKSQGLSVLSKVDEVTFQAEDHNEYMVKNKVVSHDNFPVRYANLVNGIGAKAVSENIAFGYRTAGAAVKAWINSDGHRKNLEGNYTHFGISVSQDEEGRNYYTNIFVRL